MELIISNKHCSTCKGLIFCLSFIVFVGVNFDNVSAQNIRPFNIDQIIQLLKNNLPVDTLLNQIRICKVDFELTTANSVKLVRAGADDAVLDAIKTNNENASANSAAIPFQIVLPKDGSTCGPQLRVEGKSSIYPGKYLWVFAHRSDLPGWWPQSSAVKIKTDGSWIQSVGIGQPQDIDFDFEVMARWVDENVHKEMLQYMKDGVATGNWPSIDMPEGAPSAMVTVKKIK